ncbi:hypothetical protein COOONC_16594 [Cooperia oncophora]
MGSKNRQKSAVHKKKSKGAPKVNPFELKFNRSKHDVLGKKKGAVGVGHPGLSRKRAYEQREKTLGVEYDRIGKVNKIVDRRIGEKNKSITTEEKASLRFAAERAKHLKKGSKFNLTDDNEENEELLTHGGRALTDIQKYDKTIASDDDDDDGNIGADVEKLSRKDVIADLIAKTRQAREEKHIAKDELETVTEDLDAKYLKLLDKVKNVFRPVGATKAEKSEKDDYDKLAISLKIDADARATPAERTKTAEELAVEERHYLEEMESLRRARMNAETNKKGHHSVDAELVDEKQKKKSKKVGFEVRFGSDGKLMNSDKIEPVSKKKIAIDSDEELTDEEQEDENEEELDDLLDEHDGVGEERHEQKRSKTMTVRMTKLTTSKMRMLTKKRKKMAIHQATMQKKDAMDSEERKLLTKRRKSVDNKKYEALVELLKKYPAGKIDVVLQRLIKCYHPSLAEGNKKLLSKLFLYLLRDDYEMMSKRTLSADNMKTDVEFSARCVRALIRQNWKKRMSKPKSSTQFSLITLLRLIASLFPVSDRWHPVCSPAMALAAITLAKCQILNMTVLTRQILLATVVSDYVEESRRYVPEAIAFCQGALLMAVENEENERARSRCRSPISWPHKRMASACREFAEGCGSEAVGITSGVCGR